MTTKAELVQALQDPATVGHRGSLVYALREFDCADIVPLLLGCVLDGSFEEVQHAMDIFGKMDEDVDVPTPLVERLQETATLLDWRGEAAKACLEMIE